MKTLLLLSSGALLVLLGISSSDARPNNNRVKQWSELDRVWPTVHGGCTTRTYGEQGLAWSLPPKVDCEYAPRKPYVRKGSS